MLLIPRDADRLPLTLGAKLPADVTLDIPNLTKVPGRDHMYQDAKGRMLYLPPLPPYPRKPDAAPAPSAPDAPTKPQAMGTAPMPAPQPPEHLHDSKDTATHRWIGDTVGFYKAHRGRVYEWRSTRWCRLDPSYRIDDTTRFVPLNTAPAPARAREAVPRPANAPHDATHQGGSGAFYKVSSAHPGDRAWKFKLGWNDWARTPGITNGTLDSSKNIRRLADPT